MRIIGGSARGRRLLTPKDLRIRPTSDRVKESLFNILSVLLGSFEGCRVLDIFAGTGNLGIEALSRGAKGAVFIDSDRGSVELVRRNLQLAGFADRGRVLGKEAISALKLLERSEEPFHLVFIDPPYRQGLETCVLRHLASSPLVAEETLVAVEVAADEPLGASFGSLREFDRRVYGDTSIVLFRREP